MFRKTNKTEAKALNEKSLLRVDQVVASESGGCYVVESMLGKGRFGEVHMVSALEDPDKKFAMRVETNDTDEKHRSNLRVKAETRFLDALKEATDTVCKTHFVNMHDKGKTVSFKYFVRDLIWLPLDYCVNTVCQGLLRPHTFISIARQTLKSIEAMHKLKFIHRDIQLNSFAVGLPPKDNIIYYINFGSARLMKEKKRVGRVQGKGCAMNASISALKNYSMSYKDDLEMWMYMMIEIYDNNNISWRGVRVRKHMIELKLGLLQNQMWSFGYGPLKAPRQFKEIISIIRVMSYRQEGDFETLNELLDEIVKEDEIDVSLPLDWVGKPKLPERPKKVKKKKERKKEIGEEDHEFNQENKFSSDVASLRDKGNKKSASIGPPDSDIFSQYDYVQVELVGPREQYIPELKLARDCDTLFVELSEERDRVLLPHIKRLRAEYLFVISYGRVDELCDEEWTDAKLPEWIGTRRYVWLIGSHSITADGLLSLFKDMEHGRTSLLVLLLGWGVQPNTSRGFLRLLGITYYANRFFSTRRDVEVFAHVDLKSDKKDPFEICSFGNPRQYIFIIIDGRIRISVRQWIFTLDADYEWMVHESWAMDDNDLTNTLCMEVDDVEGEFESDDDYDDYDDQHFNDNTFSLKIHHIRENSGKFKALPVTYHDT